MQPLTIPFSLAEKLAIVHALDSVIIADGNVHTGEISTLSELMHRLDFDSNSIVQARNLSTEQGILVLESMSDKKKLVIAEILNEMALADGFAHKKEKSLIFEICEAIGIYRSVL
ncbi:TerB family tellurite resistance protein [Maribacter sp. 2308TA10-17]|uniref:tellurite resistance TerB family protein n=1 Tax=Maribacter sp. 2308TA10-17 TaxID=3386276 RepID=UPI0039BC7990